MSRIECRNTSCPWTVRATEYCRGELSRRERMDFETHLPSCGSCREEVEEIDDLLQALSRSTGLTGADRGPDASDQVLARIPDAEWSRGPRTRTWIGTRAALAAGIALAALVALAFLREREATRSHVVGSTGGSAVLSDPGLALLRARDWLVSVQEADGSWSPETWGGDSSYQVALTALATLVLYGDRRASTEDAAAEAGEFLIRRQLADGHLGHRSRSSLYNHAMGTLALVELTASQPTSERTRAAERALLFLLRAQTSRGAWGYSSESGTFENESISVWALEALVRAQAYGLKSDAAPIEKCCRWFQSLRSRRVRRAVTYRGIGGHVCGQHDSPITAFAVLLRSGKAEATGARSVLEDVIRNQDTLSPDHFCFYDAYFLAKACSSAERPALAPYGLKARRELVASQVRSGPHTGSWEPGDRWSMVGGRLYTTALAALTLKNGAASRS